MAASLALALRAGRSTLAVAGVFGAGKTRSLTFLLAWLALTTHLKIAVVHKENPAGRAITKLLTAFDLEPDHQRYFIRPVSREEAETNTACTNCDLRASEAASFIPQLPCGDCHYWACLGPKRANPFHTQHSYGECGPAHQRRGSAGHGPQICLCANSPPTTLLSITTC